jgi:hypothetical protein
LAASAMIAQGMGDDVTSVLGDAEHGDHEDDPRA